MAYLVWWYPESYNISHWLLHEISLKFPDYTPKSFLDFGAGLTPTSWVVKERYPNIELLFAVEPNIYMWKMGKYMTKDIDSMNWGESIHEINFLGK